MKLRILSLAVALAFVGSVGARSKKSVRSVKSMRLANYRSRVENAQAEYRELMDIAYLPSKKSEYSERDREAAKQRMRGLDEMYPGEELSPPPQGIANPM